MPAPPAPALPAYRPARAGASRTTAPIARARNPAPAPSRPRVPPTNCSQNPQTCNPYSMMVSKARSRALSALQQENNSTFVRAPVRPAARNRRARRRDSIQSHPASSARAPDRVNEKRQCATRAILAGLGAAARASRHAHRAPVGCTCRRAGTAACARATGRRDSRCRVRNPRATTIAGAHWHAWRHRTPRPTTRTTRRSAHTRHARGRTPRGTGGARSTGTSRLAAPLAAPHDGRRAERHDDSEQCVAIAGFALDAATAAVVLAGRRLGR